MALLELDKDLNCHLPGRIDKSNDIGIKGTVDGIHDGQFTKSLHHHEHHDANDHKAEELYATTVSFSTVVHSEKGAHQ
jgi:hypothetical protein